MRFPTRLTIFTILSSILLSLPKTIAADLPGGIELRATASTTRVKPGEQIELAVTLHLPAGWIVYDLEQVPNSVLPTTVDLDPTDDIAPLETFRSTGALEERDPKFRNRLVRFFPFSPTFKRPLRISPNARPGERVIRGHIGFLAQYLVTKRFYIISRATFEATLLIDPPPAPTSSDSPPESTTLEQPVDQAETAALLAPPPPRPPVPPFHWSVNSPLPASQPARTESLPWNLILLTGVILLMISVATGILTPAEDFRLPPGWIDAWTR